MVKKRRYDIFLKSDKNTHGRSENFSSREIIIRIYRFEKTRRVEPSRGVCALERKIYLYETVAVFIRIRFEGISFPR